jgi:hypothetical protein
VASILGGVFLILIIISAYAFFMMSNQATSNLQTTINNQSSLDEDKNQENLSFNYIGLNQDNTSVVLAVVNTGSKTITINYIGINDVSANTGIYDFSEPLGNPNINPGDISSFNIIPISNNFQTGDIYSIKLITSKGSVFSFNYPSKIALTNPPPSTSTTPAIQNQQKCYILSGSYFAQSDTFLTINITSNGNPVDSYTTPASDGYCSAYLKQLPYGIYTVKLSDSNAVSAVAPLTITPYIVLSPASQSSKDSAPITIKGTGFPASSTLAITILFDNSQQVTTPAQIFTDSTGSFTATMQVSGKTAGSYVVIANYYGSNPDFLSASNIFTVSP